MSPEKQTAANGRPSASSVEGRPEMSAQPVMPMFANRGYPATRMFRAARAHTGAARRRLRPLDPRGRIAWPDFQLDATTSIMVASLGAVERTLSHSVTLGAVELACAQSYRQLPDRERYIAGRTLLRHALSKSVGGRVAPADWDYREGPYGKPTVADGLPPLEFNVSHSGGCVAVAVSMKGPVGIDIECIDPEGPPGIIYDVLTDGERDRLKKCPAERQQAEFIRIWTVKEACAKALGLGLSLEFDRMEVWLDPLRVRLLDRIARTAEPFDVASTTITSSGRNYALTVARLIA
jgi:phosphopantetheine--protein transferase-like protein